MSAINQEEVRFKGRFGRWFHDNVCRRIQPTPRKLFEWCGRPYIEYQFHKDYGWFDVICYKCKICRHEVWKGNTINI